MRSTAGAGVEEDGHQRIIFVLIEWYVNVTIDCPFSGFPIVSKKLFRPVERDNAP
jgi:hypothetical protein